MFNQVPGGILTENAGGAFTAAYAYGNGLICKDGEYIGDERVRG